MQEAKLITKKDLLLFLLMESVDKCYQNDFSLIERGMEQASVARIYFYMQEALNRDERFTSFQEHNLDSEYNKNGETTKTTHRRPLGTQPDIILHKRLNNDHNLMIIEFKASDRRIEVDFTKLEDFTSGDGIYKYFFGVFVKLDKSGAKYTYFQKGKETQKEDLCND